MDDDITDRVRDLAGGRSAASVPPWRDVLLADPCVYCGTTSVPRTMDHIHPKHLGAKHSAPFKKRPPVDNAAPACEDCNQRKTCLTLFAFVAGGGMLAARPRFVRPPRDAVHFGSFPQGCRVKGMTREGQIVVTVKLPSKHFPPVVLRGVR